MKKIIYSVMAVVFSSAQGMEIPVALVYIGNSELGVVGSYHFGSVRVGARAQTCFDIETVAVALKEKHGHLRAYLLFRTDRHSAYEKYIGFNVEKGSELTYKGQLPDSADPIEFSVDARTLIL